MGGDLGGPLPAGIEALEALISRLISLIVGLGFVAVLLMFFWGGIKYIRAEGESKELDAARQTITWAVGGMFFMVLAWIVLLIVESFTGVKVTTFCLKFNGC